MSAFVVLLTVHALYCTYRFGVLALAMNHLGVLIPLFSQKMLPIVKVSSKLAHGILDVSDCLV